MFLNDLIKRFPEIDIKDLSCLRKRRGFDLSSLKAIDDTDVVICLGYEEAIYNHFEPWLQGKRKLIFIEKDIGVFQDLPKKPINNKRVDFFLLSLEDDDLIKKIVWSYFSLKYKLICHPELMLDPICSYVKDTLRKIELGKHLAICDVADLGKKVFQNIAINSRQLISKRGANLKNAFEKVPAIICGAGPSITGEIEKIGKIKEHALIFAGGSALNVLAKKGVTPHFSGGVDPGAPFEKFQTHLGFLTPFFYQMRISHENLSLIHHEPICFGESNGALFSNFLEDKFDLPSFSSGWCVGNFLSNIALYLGCDPIIFIGMDFSYTIGNKYADSTKGPSQDQVVQKDFVMAKEYTEKLINDHPHTKFINASQWGSDSLSDALPYKVQEDLEGLIHQRLQECPMLAFNKRDLEDLYKSFMFCKDAFVKDFANSEKIVKKQSAFVYILSPVWNIFASLILSQSKGDMMEEEKKMHQYVFFQKVIDIYIEEIERAACGRQNV